MKKEVLLAILVGSVIGLFLAFGFYKANKAVKNRAQTAVSDTTETPAKNHLQTIDDTANKISLLLPLNNQVFFDQSATISGQVTANTPIAIITEENEYITISDLAGKFSQPITLIKGINEITVISVANMDQTDEQKLSLIYTTESLNDE